MKLRGIALAAALLTAAGCSDSTEPIVGFNGALSFTFTGAGGGTHSVEGDFTAAGANPETVDWAYGVRVEEESIIGVTSSQPRTSTTHDYTVISINRLTAGSSTISADCDPEVDSGCTGFVFYRGVSNATGTFEYFCTITNGSVNISSISGSRVQGTFSGSGFCFDADINDEPFTVTSGTFNVALLTTTLN